METFLAVIFAGLALFVVSQIIWQWRNGTVPLLSTRNFFLAGFTVFQLSSAMLALGIEYYGDVGLSTPGTTGLVYLLMVVLFLSMFLISYKRGWFIWRIARRVRPEFPVPSVAGTLSLAIAFLLLGFFFKMVLIYVPLVGILSAIFGTALAAVAAGMVMWVWAPRLANPVVGAVAMAVIIAAIGLAIWQNFGRRDVVSVLLAALWGGYHGHWKHVGLGRMVIPFALTGAGVIAVVAAFTATRTEHNVTNTSYTDAATRLMGADLKAGTIDLLAGQDAAANSMWLIESRPGAFPYDTLHSLVYAVTQPVPRRVWNEKPEGLGLSMVPEAGVINKSPGFTLGPGIIGHIANDNPWIALPLYAIGIGLFLRLLDELVIRHPINPFVILPIGAALGEILALPRGELGLFFFRTVVAIVAAWVGMRVCCRVMLLMGWRFGTSEPVADEYVEEGDEYSPELAAGYAADR